MALDLLAAIGALALLTLIPGPDFAITVRWAASGSTSGLRAGTGVVAGLAVWGLLTAAGLSALVTASPVAYAVLRYAGAVYLAFLGARLVWRSLRERTPVLESDPARGPAFRQGLATNLLNPKIAVFYLAALPALAPVGLPHPLAMGLLVAIHVALNVVWLGACVWLVSRGRRAFARPRIRAWLDRVTALVFVAFAARLAADASAG